MGKHTDKFFSDEWGGDHADVHPVWETRTQISPTRWQALSTSTLSNSIEVDVSEIQSDAQSNEYTD